MQSIMQRTYSVAHAMHCTCNALCMQCSCIWCFRMYLCSSWISRRKFGGGSICLLLLVPILLVLLMFFNDLMKMRFMNSTSSTLVSALLEFARFCPWMKCVRRDWAIPCDFECELNGEIARNRSKNGGNCTTSELQYIPLLLPLWWTWLAVSWPNKEIDQYNDEIHSAS
jgi:hypothetical protein